MAGCARRVFALNSLSAILARAAEPLSAKLRAHDNDESPAPVSMSSAVSPRGGAARARRRGRRITSARCCGSGAGDADRAVQRPRRRMARADRRRSARRRRRGRRRHGCARKQDAAPICGSCSRRSSARGSISWSRRRPSWASARSLPVMTGARVVERVNRERLRAIARRGGGAERAADAARAARAAAARSRCIAALAAGAPPHPVRRERRRAARSPRRLRRAQPGPLGRADRTGGRVCRNGA